MSVDEKGCAVADLGDGCMSSQIPHGCCKQILAGSKKRTEIVGFISPVGKVSAAGTCAYSLLIYIEHELVIGTDIDIEVLRRCGEFDGLSEVEHDLIALRDVGSGDPLGLPVGGLMFRRELRARIRCAQGKSKQGEERSYSHARDRTSAKARSKVRGSRMKIQTEAADTEVGGLPAGADANDDLV